MCLTGSGSGTIMNKAKHNKNKKYNDTNNQGHRGNHYIYIYENIPQVQEQETSQQRDHL